MNILVFEQLMSTIDFHRRKTILWMSMVLINCLDNKHFQNIVCVQQDKETHKYLEQVEGEQMMTSF